MDIHAARSDASLLIDGRGVRERSLLLMMQKLQATTRPCGKILFPRVGAESNPAELR